MKKTVILLIFLFSLNFYGQKDFYQYVLETYVDSNNGDVDYKSLKPEEDKLLGFLVYTSLITPQKDWSENKEKAYWINTYNSNMLMLVVNNYPFKKNKVTSKKNSTNFHVSYSKKKNSILSIEQEGQEIWDIPYINIGGKNYTLNEVEHKIIRKKFKDPRVHVAFNSACKSGPKIPNFMFTEENINATLDQLMKDFINDTTKNNISENKIKLSKIFKWYKEDFIEDFTLGDSSLINYINKYSNIKVNNDAEVEFLDFNWQLNEM